MTKVRLRLNENGQMGALRALEGTRCSLLISPNALYQGREDYGSKAGKDGVVRIGMAAADPILWPRRKTDCRNIERGRLREFIERAR